MPLPTLDPKRTLDHLLAYMENQEITFKHIADIWDDPAFIVEDLGKDAARKFAEKILEACDES